jgi:hypothetical protein
LIGFQEIIEEDIMTVIKDSIVNGRMSVAFNATFIALIPKMGNPSSIKEYKPISLCTCKYYFPQGEKHFI